MKNQILSQTEITNRANDNLFQNYYLFGIDPNDLDIKDFTKEINFTDKDFKQLKLLSKFPPGNSPYEIDPLIIMNHCFPKGYKLFERDTNPHDEFFFFSLESLNKLNFENKKI